MGSLASSSSCATPSTASRSHTSARAGASGPKEGAAVERQAPAARRLLEEREGATIEGEQRQPIALLLVRLLGLGRLVRSGGASQGTPAPQSWKETMESVGSPGGTSTGVPRTSATV